jgi:hypothetical protein
MSSKSNGLMLIPAFAAQLTFVNLIGPSWRSEAT